MEEKLADRISTIRKENEDNLLLEGWKQQIRAEDLLYPEGRDCGGDIEEEDELEGGMSVEQKNNYRRQKMQVGDNMRKEDIISR